MRCVCGCSKWLHDCKFTCSQGWVIVYAAVYGRHQEEASYTVELSVCWMIISVIYQVCEDRQTRQVWLALGCMQASDYRQAFEEVVYGLYGQSDVGNARNGTVLVYTYGSESKVSLVARLGTVHLGYIWLSVLVCLAVQMALYGGQRYRKVTWQLQEWMIRLYLAGSLIIRP